MLFFFFLREVGLKCFFFFSSRRRHTRWPRDWSSDVCSSDLPAKGPLGRLLGGPVQGQDQRSPWGLAGGEQVGHVLAELLGGPPEQERVELLLGQGAPVDQRVEAGDHAVALALGVVPDE